MDVRADRFPLVDSLRAIAALAIVGYHAAFFSGMLDQASVGSRLATNLQVGVPVFFLISGFLLYRPFAKARLLGEPPPAAGAYAWRRFLRIAPAYWVALTLAGLLGVAVAFEGPKLPAYYGFAQIYSAQTYYGGLPQAWTLCVEVTFYALLPFWALALRRLRVRRPADWLRQEVILLGSLFLVSLAYKVVVVLSVDLNALGSQPLLMMIPNFLDLFAVGMGLGVASVWREQRSEGGGAPMLDAHAWVAWAVAAAAFAAVLALGPAGELQAPITRTEFLVRHELWLLCAFAIALPGMLGDPRIGRVRRLLSARALPFLGLISYGIFLQHITVMSQLRDWGFATASGELWAWLAWAAVGGTAAIALGAASYYAVERPALALKRLVPARRQERGEATAETAPASPRDRRSAAPR